MKIKKWYSYSRILAKAMFTNAYDKLDLFVEVAKVDDIFKAPTENVFIINEAEAIKYILHTKDSVYSKKGSSFAKVEIGLGKGLITNYGEAWAKRRKEMQPRFYHKGMSCYGPVITTMTDRMLDQWSTFAKCRKKVNAVTEMSALVLNISAISLFGKDIGAKCHSIVRDIRHANDTLAMGKYFWVPTYRNLRYRRYKKRIDALSIDLLRGPHDNEFGTEPLLDSLFLPKDGSETPELRETMLGEAKNFMLAGHETTACALTWALYELWHNPEVLRKLRYEIDTVMGSDDITYEDLPNLPYTQMVIDETLRLYPSIWVTERRALEEDQIGQYKVPKNSLVLISAYTVHRNPKYWNDPEKFMPERFTSEEIAKRPKNSYIPFGTGPRVCIGKHLALPIAQLVLAKIIQRYDYRLTTRKRVNIDPLITLKPEDDIMMRIWPRETVAALEQIA